MLKSRPFETWRARCLWRPLPASIAGCRYYCGAATVLLTAARGGGAVSLKYKSNIGLKSAPQAQPVEMCAIIIFIRWLRRLGGYLTTGAAYEPITNVPSP